MQPHQERVVVEKRELDEKLSKLVSFIGGSPLFGTLDEDERGRLVAQADYMRGYSNILGERIEAFPKEAA